jgi:hypothetical protein
MKQLLIRQGRQKANNANGITHNICNNDETVLIPEVNISHGHSYGKSPQSSYGNKGSEEYGLHSLSQ